MTVRVQRTVTMQTAAYRLTVADLAEMLKACDDAKMPGTALVTIATSAGDQRDMTPGHTTLTATA